MTYLRKHSRLVLVAAACVTVGAAGSAIATAGAASSPQTPTTTSAKTAPASTLRARRLLARRAVHGDVVVATKSGFMTVTFDRGFVQSVNGQQLTLREGTKKATYKTVTLTIPTNAKVRDNGQSSTLSAVSAGQRVAVVQGPKQTWVVAHTPRS